MMVTKKRRTGVEREDKKCPGRIGNSARNISIATPTIQSEDLHMTILGSVMLLEMLL